MTTRTLLPLGFAAALVCLVVGVGLAPAPITEHIDLTPVKTCGRVGDQ